MPEVPDHDGPGVHNAAPGQSQYAASHVSLQRLQSDANLRIAAGGGVERGRHCEEEEAVRLGKTDGSNGLATPAYFPWADDLLSLPLQR